MTDLHAGAVRAPEGAELSERQKWFIFAIVGTALFMTSLDMTIITTALDAIHRSLHAKLNWTGWSVTGFTLGMTVTMPVAGRLSDQFGRKRIFIGASVLFTAASLACGVANSIGLLIVLRVLQAIGGGAFMPSATGIVADHFGENRDRAVALFTSILPIGGILGPIFGGLIVGYWSWRGIFFLNVPIGIAVVVLATRRIPNSPPRPAERADFAGMALLGGLILAVMIGISDFGEAGTTWDAPGVLVPELAGVVLIVAFARHLRRSASPIIPPRLLGGRGFLQMNLLNFLYGAATIGMGSLVPLYAVDRYGLSTIASGTVLTARAVGTIAVAGVTSFLLRRTGYRLPILVGFVLIGVGSVLLFIASPGIGPYGWLTIGAGVTGLGMGVSMPAVNNATLALAPEHIAGIVGLRGMFRQAGSILSVSVMTAVITRSASPGHALGLGFVVFAAVLALFTPLVFTVPERRGAW